MKTVNLEEIYIDDNKGIIYSRSGLVLDFMHSKISESQINKLRKVDNSFANHCKEELRLSLKIAKLNVNLDPLNKYYLSKLEEYQLRKIS